MGVRLVTFFLFYCLSLRVDADQYWIAYEGNDLPESVGWNRHYYTAQPAGRQVLNGALQLDSRSDYQTFDFYEINRPINPSEGEVFIAEWRVRTIENDGFLADPGIVIAPDQGGTLGFRFFLTALLAAAKVGHIQLSRGNFTNSSLCRPTWSTTCFQSTVYRRCPVSGI